MKKEFAKRRVWYHFSSKSKPTWPTAEIYEFVVMKDVSLCRFSELMPKLVYIITIFGIFGIHMILSFL